MLINLGVPILLYTSKNGELKIKENVSFKNFIEDIKNRRDNVYPDQPLIAIQTMNDKTPWKEAETVATAQDLEGRYSSGPSYKQIFKEYIRSSGERMQMYRLFYYNSRKAPIVVTFAKIIKFADPRYMIEQRYLLNDNDLEHIQQFIQAGKSIERMQNEAKKICNILSRAYGFRVEELVADFVKDGHDVFWLINVKYFLLESTNYELKKQEHEHLIKKQAVALEILREQASDSSILLIS